ncbi:hypothetical protein [Halobacillus karajensis]|nr:hypothetical protein [Halobacillus karajensis]CDQ17977.1 hypothetical protein BN982_00217 [Halobacillus karajensis]
METHIKPPKISEDTMKEMAKFFMKTSVPRVIAKRKQEQQKEEKRA